MAYGELYFQAIDNNCKIELATYNSAPLRVEHFEELLTRRAPERNKDTSDEEVSLAFKTMYQIINNGDLVNNLLYGLTSTIEGFNHIGYRLIIDSITGDDKNDTSIRYYAEEHIDIYLLCYC